LWIAKVGLGVMDNLTVNHSEDVRQRYKEMASLLVSISHDIEGLS
jgi:hypothetical protein